MPTTNSLCPSVVRWKPSVEQLEALSPLPAISQLGLIPDTKDF